MRDRFSLLTDLFLPLTTSLLFFVFRILFLLLFVFNFLKLLLSFHFKLYSVDSNPLHYIYANIKTKRILLLVFFLLLRLCFRSHMQTHTHTSSHTRSHTISSQSFNSSSYFDWCSCCCCFYCFLFLQYNVLDILMCMYKCS